MHPQTIAYHYQTKTIQTPLNKLSTLQTTTDPTKLLPNLNLLSHNDPYTKTQLRKTDLKCKCNLENRSTDVRLE